MEIKQEKRFTKERPERIQYLQLRDLGNAKLAKAKENTLTGSYNRRAYTESTLERPIHVSQLLEDNR